MFKIITAVVIYLVFVVSLILMMNVSRAEGLTCPNGYIIQGESISCINNDKQVVTNTPKDQTNPVLGIIFIIVILGTIIIAIGFTTKDSGNGRSGENSRYGPF